MCTYGVYLRGIDLSDGDNSDKETTMHVQFRIRPAGRESSTPSWTEIKCPAMSIECPVRPTDCSINLGFVVKHGKGEQMCLWECLTLDYNDHKTIHKL